MKEGKKIFHTNGNKKKARIARLISDKNRLRRKSIIMTRKDTT